MIYPKFIQKNDTIGITAPSGGILDDVDIIRIENSKNNFERLGYNILETEDVKNKDIFCQSDKEENQAKQLNYLFKNKDVKAIICTAGGEFMCKIMPYIDFENIQKNPKWFQGYSDPTWLTYVITTKMDIATIYSYNFKAFCMEYLHSSLKNNIEILSGNIILQNSFEKFEGEYVKNIVGNEEFSLTTEVCWKNLNGEEKIEFEGRIIGGCLDILLEIFGTKYDFTKNFIEKYSNDGIIWYFDNCELSYYEVIRTLHKFKDNGYFKNTKGIIFGRNILKDNKISFEDALKNILGDTHIPVIFDIDIGHTSPELTIINGSIAHIVSQNGKGKISFNLV